MNKKLLNIFKNLIIVFTLVLIFFNILTSSVFAANSMQDNQFSTYMKEKIAMWYFIIRAIAIGVMVIVGILLAFKYLLLEKTPENISKFKELFVDWLIGIILIMFIHYFMIGVVHINEMLVEQAQEVGKNISGLNMADDEYDLYESALTKAYELNAMSGLIGLIMYAVLVVYTYKFVIVYAKRYLNIIILILLAPIMLLISSFKKVLSGGSAHIMGKWVKEFIYNVLIQFVHAIFYASTIGLTLKLSDNVETFGGALLSLLIFTFIFKIDALFRKVFNFVGGKSTIRQIDIGGTFNKSRRMLTDYKNGEGALFDEKEKWKNRFENLENMDKDDALELAKNSMIKFSNKAMDFRNEAKDTIEGKKIKVTEEEVEDAERMLKTPDGILENVIVGSRKVYEGEQKLVEDGKKIAKNVLQDTKRLTSKVKNKVYDLKKVIDEDINDLNQQYEMVKHLPHLIRSFSNKVARKVSTIPELDKIFQVAVDLSKTSKEVVEELKEKVENETKDILASVYELMGPQAFLYNKVGSPIMGMRVLAESIYNSRLARAIMGDNSKENRTLKLGVQENADEELVMEENTNSEVKKLNPKVKKYKFNRFSYSATKTIVHSLEQKVIINQPYLSVIHNISGKIALGELMVSGDVSLRATKISYTAKANSASMLHQQAKLTLETFSQTRIDGKWAQISSIVANATGTVRNKTNNQLAKINQMPIARATMNTLVRMGKSHGISSDLMLMTKDVAKKVGHVAAPAIMFKEAIVNSVVTKKEAVKSVINNVQAKLQNTIEDTKTVVMGVQEIFGLNPEKSMVNLIPAEVVEEHPQVENLQQVGIIEQDKIVQFVLTDNGEIVNQIVSLDGDIIEQAQDEYKTNEKGQMIQHVVNMEGVVVEQLVNVNADGISSVVISDEYTEANISYDSEEVVKDIRALAYQEISGNLATIEKDEKSEELSQVIQFTQAVNVMGIPELSATSEQDTSIVLENKINNFNNLLEQIAPPDLLEQVTVSSENDEMFTQEEVKAAMVQKIVVDAAIDNKIYTVTNESIYGNVDAKMQILEEVVKAGIYTESEVEIAQNEIASVIQGIDGNAVIDELANRATVEAIQNDSIDEKAKQFEQLVDALKDGFDEGVKEEREVVKERKSKGNDEEEKGNEKISVSLTFTGCVEEISTIKMDNHTSIFKFLKWVKLTNKADLDKSQKWFVESHNLPGNYSFSNPPLESMDGWTIYIVEKDDPRTVYESETEDELPRATFWEKVETNMELILELLEKYFTNNKITDLEIFYNGDNAKSETKKLCLNLLPKLQRRANTPKGRKEEKPVFSKDDIYELIKRLDSINKVTELINKLSKNIKPEERAEKLVKDKVKSSEIVKTEDIKGSEEVAEAEKERENNETLNQQEEAINEMLRGSIANDLNNLLQGVVSEKELEYVGNDIRSNKNDKKLHMVDEDQNEARNNLKNALYSMYQQ